jgi:uracil phosphoribosyltransferase
MIDNHAIGAGNIMLACSSEDADWLSKGILDQLKDQDIEIKLAVFWNLRVNPADNQELAIAPIVKSYIEKIDKVDYLIICKSIISSSCVVRTNITSLIETIDPLKICIASPVLYEQAIPNLMSEFPSQVSEKFEFFYFAVDDELNNRQEVVPGIGGSVYKRLGLEDSLAKNKYIPSIVKERRASYSSEQK